MKMKMKNRLHRYDKIDLGLDMGTNIENIKIVSVWWCLSLLSNTSATSEAKFMKKLSNTEAELKKSVAYKKSVQLMKKLRIWGSAFRIMSDIPLDIETFFIDIILSIRAHSKIT